jgi:probable rRNA maturation factor
MIRLLLRGSGLYPKNIPFRNAVFTEELRDVCRACAVAPTMQVSYVLYDETRMQKLNRQLRHKDKPTDVLAFPAKDTFADLSSSSSSFCLSIPEELQSDLGSVILCLPDVARRAELEKTCFYERLYKTAIHGTLHLLGYDHETDAQWIEMTAREKQAYLSFVQLRRSLSDSYTRENEH